MDRRIVGAMIALVALGSLTSCAHQARSTNTPVGDGTTLSAGRFQETAAKLAEFRSFLSDKQTPDVRDSVQADRSGAENAASLNKLLGVDENSPAHFAIVVKKEYETPDGPTSSKLSSQFVCIEFDNNTYYASRADFYYAGRADFAVLLGDGPCSNEEGDAVVVGDPNRNTDTDGVWTKGAEFMGDLTPGDFLNNRNLSN